MNMKRITAFVLCILLIVSCSAMAENSHQEIRISIMAGGQSFPIDADLYAEDGMTYTVSSLFPDQCLKEAADSAVPEILNTFPVLFRMAMDEQNISMAKECLQEWIRYLQPEIITGSFAGDAFTHASKMEMASFTYGDLMILYRLMVSSLTNQDQLITDENNSLVSSIPEKNYHFILKLFDDRKFMSLNVMDRKDTIMTLSADVSVPGQITAVLGYGLAEKNYYHRIQLETEYGHHVSINIKSYADDNRTGFLSVNEKDLIATWHFSAEMSGEENTMVFDLVMAPGNESLTPIKANGTVFFRESGRLLEADAGFYENSDLNVYITVDQDDQMIDSEKYTVMDLAASDPEAIEKLVVNAGQAIMPSLAQIVSVIPPEYQQLLLFPDP